MDVIFAWMRCADASEIGGGLRRRARRASTWRIGLQATRICRELGHFAIREVMARRNPAILFGIWTIRIRQCSAPAITRASAVPKIRVTLPNGLDTGFQVMIVNVGTGTITLSASTTLNTADSKTTITKQYGLVAAYHAGSNVWRAGGLLA